MNKNNLILIPLNNNNVIQNTNYCLFNGLYSVAFETECTEIVNNEYLKIFNIEHGEYILSSYTNDITII